MLKTNITDGTGTKRQAKVDDLNSLVVSLSCCPPLMDQKTRIFRQYLTTNGTPTGTSSMLVDGSTTNVDYYVPAHQYNDRYITAVNFVIEDTAPSLNGFGDNSALANGCVFEYKRGSGEVVAIHGALKSNFDFIRMCMGYPAFGSGTSAYELTNAIGTAEAYMPVFNFLKIMPPYGLKIDAGSEQRLTLRIRDNVSTIIGMDAIVYGFERLP